MADTTWLVAGLGNPGTRYQYTRHNIGQMVLADRLERIGLTYRKLTIGAEVAEATLGAGGPKIVFAISSGYMNTSGKPMVGLLNYLKIPAERLVVIHDELDLPFGSLKFKQGGSEGGHNGLKSITSHLQGSRDYLRLRVGIGRPPNSRMDTADFVLAPFNSEEKQELPEFVERAGEALETLIDDGLSAAQNAYH